jgi:hypothetical protein
MVTIGSALRSINSDPLHHLGGIEAVERACVVCKHAWRHARSDSPLDPAGTLAMFVRQVIAGDRFSLPAIFQTAAIASSEFRVCLGGSPPPLVDAIAATIGCELLSSGSDGRGR